MGWRGWQRWRLIDYRRLTDPVLGLLTENPRHLRHLRHPVYRVCVSVRITLRGPCPRRACQPAPIAATTNSGVRSATAAGSATLEAKVTTTNKRFRGHNQEALSPRFNDHPDTGCEASSACLTCPLPQCKYDDWTWYNDLRLYHRAKVVVDAMDAAGLTREEPAGRFGISLRTVSRYRRRVNAG